jgi:cupin 2 domain-containing protein
MDVNIENILKDIPAELPEELVGTILQAGNLRVERIVSQGHVSPPGFWYDQPQHEWVVVLEGNALVQFENDPEPIELERGSCLTIPAHARHRVAWTAPDRKTVWLAIHYGP